jgi:hypothetical protein
MGEMMVNILKKELTLVDKDWGGRESIARGNIEIIEGLTSNAILLTVDGYDCMTGEDDAVIMIEFYQGKLQVHLWDDINEESPKTFSLEGARKEKRDEEIQVEWPTRVATRQRHI